MLQFSEAPAGQQFGVPASCGHGWGPAQVCWHVITPEYPPMFGGVSDYTQSIAKGLAHQGDEVHVWCPVGGAPEPDSAGLVVHPELGKIRVRDLRGVELQLDRFPAPRRILIQWVPHGYGPHAINIGFCWWALQRALFHGDQVEFMVHEAFLDFSARSWRQSAVALVHRLMTLLWLGACQRVWLSIPAWEQRLRPYALGRKITFSWLPIPSNVPVTDDRGAVDKLRRRYAPNHEFIIGHFGTFGFHVARIVEAVIVALAGEPSPPMFLLIGKGGELFRAQLIRRDPRLEPLLHASGEIAPEELSCQLQACDLLIQPYPDGLSTRRGTIMAGLSHGRPIVTTRGLLTEPFWEESNALAMAPAKDPKGIVSLVRQLQSNPTERARIGAAARKLYQERFNLCHTVAALRQTAVKSSACAS